MTHDPVAAQFPLRTRARVWFKRVATWQRWALLGAMLAVVALALGLVANERSNNAIKRTALVSKQTALLSKQAADEAKARIQQLQDAFCGNSKVPGLLPTILSAKLPPGTSQLGKNLVIGAHYAATAVHCPGVR